jgi:hypothetical protein
MNGGEPMPNRFGATTRTTSAVTNVTKATATTITALGTANPAGCSRAAATKDRDVDRMDPMILCMLEDCADMLVKLSFY